VTASTQRAGPVRAPGLLVACLLAILHLAQPGYGHAQQSDIRGVVSETALGASLAGCLVEVRAGDAVIATAQTDRLGRFVVRDVAPGSYTVVVTRLGYAEATATDVLPSPAGGPLVKIELEPLPFTLDPVLVTASMSAESRLDSPVSATVISNTEVEESAVPTAADHLAYVPGVDFARKGLGTYAFSTRGPRNLTPQSMLYLSDYRYAAVPYLRTNTALLVPYNADDVERIEVIRGPGAVLYGPNSRRGVFHVIHKSPLGPDQTSVSVLGGTREYADASFRLSRSFADSTIGFKISGRYMRGREWPYTDSVEVRQRQAAIDAGADSETLLLGRREDDIEGLYGEARLDWAPAEDLLVVTTLGASRATGIETGGEAGAAQALDWVQAYLQNRIERGPLLVNLMYDWGDAGDSYNLRNGVPITNNSRLFAGQAQYEWEFGHTRLLTGTDVLLTVPRTEGTLNGRFEDDDNVAETGLYAYATTSVTPKFDVITALRADHHNRLDQAWFLSPRAGVVLKPSPTQGLRVTFSRTFEQPPARSMFADFSLGPLGPLPYNIELFGLGGEGLATIRTCDGLCMRAPDAFGGMGGALLPAEGTARWPVVVGLLAAQGVDISQLPPPSPQDVGTVFGSLNFNSGAFDPVAASSIVDTEPIRRVEESVLELGYKALLSSRLFVGADVYFTHASNVFASGAAVLTPNVFLDPASLTSYLSQYMPSEQAQQLAAGIAAIPLGTVAVENSSNSDILVAPFGSQGGSYDYWGVDLMAEVTATQRLSLQAGYSWISRDSASLGVNDAFLLFNVPRNKGFVGARYEVAERGLFVQLKARAVQAFSVNTPAYVGRTDDYALVDLGAGYELPWAPSVGLFLDVTNLFDDRHTELVGSPEIGRWVVLRTRVSF